MTGWEKSGGEGGRETNLEVINDGSETGRTSSETDVGDCYNVCGRVECGGRGERSANGRREGEERQRERTILSQSSSFEPLELSIRDRSDLLSRLESAAPGGDCRKRV